MPELCDGVVTSPKINAGDVVLPGQTAQIIRMVPEKEGHVIDLQWAIPPQQKLYRASPCGYLGHLLG